MKKLAIRGEEQRGEEVIALLEMLGGKNVYNIYDYTGDSEDAYYHLYACNYVACDELPCDENEYKLYTLDEFWVDFPYKVGDKVKIGFLNAEAEVKKMQWNKGAERIEYECKHVSNGEFTTAIAEDLIPIEDKPAEDNTKDEPINIAEILKDAPKGTKLYSTIHGDVTFSRIGTNKIQPYIIVETVHGYDISFTKEGKYNNRFYEGECLLFPSKDNRDWSTFKVEPQFPITIHKCSALLDLSVDDGDNYTDNQLTALRKLLIARDAWWKVDNDWKPDWSEESDTWKYVIIRREDEVLATEEVVIARTLAFRKEEIRDKFLETFRYLIEECKELI